MSSMDRVADALERIADNLTTHREPRITTVDDRSAKVVDGDGSTQSMRYSLPYNIFLIWRPLDRNPWFTLELEDQNGTRRSLSIVNEDLTA